MSKIGYCVMGTDLNSCCVTKKEFKSEEELKKFRIKTTIALHPVDGCDSVWSNRKDAENRCEELKKYYTELNSMFEECIEE